MPQWLLTAYDGTDADAPARRMAARPNHLETYAALKKNGNSIAGGAILDDEGNMIGSAMLLEFPSREEFDEWYNNDPYVTGGVWKTVTIQPFRQAKID